MRHPRKINYLLLCWLYYTSDFLLIHHILKHRSRCCSLPRMADISPSIHPLPRHRTLSQSRKRGNISTSIQFSISFCGLLSWCFLRVPVALPLGIYSSPRATLSPGSATLGIVSQILALFVLGLSGLLHKDLYQELSMCVISATGNHPVLWLGWERQTV